MSDFKVDKNAAMGSYFAALGDDYMKDKYFDGNGIAKSYPQGDLSQLPRLSNEQMARDRMFMAQQDPFTQMGAAGPADAYPWARGLQGMGLMNQGMKQGVKRGVQPQGVRSYFGR